MSGIVKMNAISVQTVEKAGSVHYNTNGKNALAGGKSMQTAKRPRALGLIVAFLAIVLFVTVCTPLCFS